MTRIVNCAKTDAVTVQCGVAHIDLPDESVFTLVRTWKNSK
jgi:hypothetical protein